MAGGNIGSNNGDMRHKLDKGAATKLEEVPTPIGLCEACDKGYYTRIVSVLSEGLLVFVIRSFDCSSYEPGFLLWFGECKYVSWRYDMSVYIVLAMSIHHGSYGLQDVVAKWYSSALVMVRVSY